MVILHVMAVWQKQFFKFKGQLKDEAERGVNQHQRMDPNGLAFPSLLYPRSPTVEKFVQVSWYPYGISQGKMMMMNSNIRNL